MEGEGGLKAWQEKEFLVQPRCRTAVYIEWEERSIGKFRALHSTFLHLSNSEKNCAPVMCFCF